MRIIERIGSDFHLDITGDELGIIQAALNEVCNGIDVQEFETRLGASLDEVRSLLSLVGSLWGT